jgi:hypothetical protein
MLLESPDSSPVSHSPKIAPIAPVAEDDGVFMLEDEDGDDVVDEEEVPEESSGRHADMFVDFGLSMTEYDPEDYVPANRRLSDPDSPKPGMYSPKPKPPQQDEFLGTSFTGSPRLQSALQSLHQQTKSRSRTNSDVNGGNGMLDRFSGAGELAR